MDHFHSVPKWGSEKRTRDFGLKRFWVSDPSDPVPLGPIDEGGGKGVGGVRSSVSKEQKTVATHKTRLLLRGPFVIPTDLYVTTELEGVRGVGV